MSESDLNWSSGSNSVLFNLNVKQTGNLRIKLHSGASLTIFSVEKHKVFNIMSVYLYAYLHSFR